MESSSFFTDSEPTEEQEPKKKREKPAKPSKPSRAERKAEKKKAKEEAKAAKAQKKAAGRRGATSPNAPSLTGMEKIAVKVSRLQKVTAGLAVIAVLAGGVAVVSEIDANNRIAEAFSGTTEVVAATKTIHAGDEISAKRPCLRLRPEQHGGGRRQSPRRISTTPPRLPSVASQPSTSPRAPTCTNGIDCRIGQP